MNDKLKRTKPAVLITGLVMTILGIVIFVHPIAAMEMLIRIIGIVLIAYGAFNIVTAFVRGDPLKNSPASLALGALTLLPGLFFAVNPSGFITLAWTFVGIVILVTGIVCLIVGIIVWLIGRRVE